MNRKIKILLIITSLFVSSCISPTMKTVKASKTSQLKTSCERKVNVNKGVVATAMFKSGGSSHTHQYIVKNALAILKVDKGTCNLNATAASNLLKEYCDWPDVIGNETDTGTFAGHFYDPDTRKNWLGNSSPTAKGRALSYLDKAIEDYEEGNVNAAYKSLGKGLHYIADLNEPHHASNLTAINSNHSEFEKYVDNNLSSFYVTNNSIAASYYSEISTKSMSNILQSSAVIAKSLSSKAQNEGTYYSAANESVIHAIICSVQYMYKFCVETGIF